MTPILNVYALPRFIKPEELAGGTAVVIDVLRAATTIAYALDAGAVQVLPCLEVSDAVAAAQTFSPHEIVLGGEREGAAIDGFDLGNSPEDYTADRVGGKTLIFTTTNGTRAMRHAKEADEILIASFVTCSAVVAKLVDHENIHIVCAGTDGRISEDDVLAAGLLVERIQRQRGIYQLNAQALTAREFWLNSFALPQSLGAEMLGSDRLAEALHKTLGAQNLIALGLADDILAAAQIDRFSLVPRLDPKAMRIARWDG